MKVPLSELKKFLTINKSPEEIADKLTMIGLEVEKIERIDFSFSGVLIAKLEKIDKHPKSEKLLVVKLSTGKKTYSVVCKNHTLLLSSFIAFAPPGAQLASNTIDVTKVKDITSEGMICTEKDLLLSSIDNEPLTFSNNSLLGADVAKELYNPIFDITCTPNLGYARSIRGVARELAAAFNLEIKEPIITLIEDTKKTTNDKIFLSNQDSDHCPQYFARVLENVKVGPSPLWLKNTLLQCGYQSTNNVVDILNFVMNHYGQPMHAFDLNTIEGRKINIRPSEKDESIILLDNKEYTLTENTLIIADSKKPIAVAGVMGGLDSSVTKKTTSILLEAAQFTPQATRKSSKDLKIRSESSSRFENGIDPNNIKHILDIAAEMIRQETGCTVLKGIEEQSTYTYKHIYLTLRLNKARQLIGAPISLNEADEILQRLGYGTKSDQGSLLQVSIPSWRNDIKYEVDIIDDIARIYGFEHLTTSKRKQTNSLLLHHPLYLFTRKVRNELIKVGLQEFLTCNLLSEQQCSRGLNTPLFANDTLRVLYAKSKDQSVLRPSLLPSLLPSIRLNQNHGQHSIRCMEIGKVHFKKNGAYFEKNSAAILIKGPNQAHWKNKEIKSDFYQLKGLIETLFSQLKIENVTFNQSHSTSFHPHRQVSIEKEGETFCILGQLHPQVILDEGIKGEVFYAEIDMDILFYIHKKNKSSFHPLPLYPGSQRDWTLSTTSTIQNLQKGIKKINSSLLKDIHLIDSFVPSIELPKQKNLTFRLTYRDDTRTLDENEIEKEHLIITTFLQKTLEENIELSDR